jgi:uncharacterized phosphosugar-binding protein
MKVWDPVYSNTYNHNKNLHEPVKIRREYLPIGHKECLRQHERRTTMARNYIQEYLDEIEKNLEEICATQQDAIRNCATIMADKIAEDGLIYIFGSGGHSNMMAEEMFHRAGGLACISPIFADSIRIPHVPIGERCDQLVPYIFDFYGLKKGDVLLLVNGYGINPVTIESYLEAERREITVIAVTSSEYANRLPKDFPGRHKSGLNLHEIAENLVLTNVPYGDGIIQMDQVESVVGAYSTYCNAFACNSLVLETSRILVERGIEPPIINSINVIDGAEKNKKLYDHYRPRIRYL